MDDTHNISYDRVAQAGQVRFFAPLFVAKIGAKYMSPGPNYAAGMIGMMRGLAKDLAPVRVNLVSPGAMETEMWKTDGMSKGKAQETRAELGKKVLTGQLGKPGDVAVSDVHGTVRQIESLFALYVRL
ncbi:uncharacterized protein PAC_00919 [Phialocephala subalpina]|uniref:Short chain dehydrogenase n=1 Tax=Phialocephala subalpina TaxID=576137 RepID=A0A1L7WE71_9HELO|nr:uncharacterized protein PAC_00919 [Phialocephala subalpina]